ncbi:MAG TPA: 16S rRNA (adenine(1518)-N(6)/adenine(1519)-N(6))-dimethyltransferase RsmA [Leptospiraceae bacterium]|nr:16S rRNA (adenine(1518)-N(6)/adenine(1519)-N(6))-dimethyltransferase RsmA [Leptospiraceae bacterium]HMW06929.1 16S rRNA (adenine(1518)-N(6)/adenine(1519)-N(6))-dimethyltransferase RsmA [Leptospiraceae bacterium]HMX32291.1 16S rRNA (adenine(1518)-N(6)/adenine(1519)-N(6))-dimethyltransferase RsmA [Leptospiraceae bacterium]HMY33459.1 16S rRNA (adenine(1518)-N(6)/adenine(1519)-N(6))-dimethyltransferase RsmA [Leptospiraceae bacterium]HMZ65493.1 16S rRNA (adenine(1518)-N(6)/adenine(1519)-N(6))-dim
MSYEYPYYSISKIRNFLESKNANPLKKWGQNFIIDPNILDFIIQSIDKNALAQSSCLAEIGIGLGALTHKLAQLNQRLVLFEIDPVYIEHMKELEYFQSGKFVLSEGDVLKNLNILKDETVYLTGNLPYYITSDILISSIKSIPHLTGAIFMVQKEFADRICNEISSLSIFLSIFGKFTYLKKISPTCFYPKPEASSALIQFVPTQNSFTPTQIEKFELLLKSLFWGKRKTIGKSISEAPFLNSKEFTENYPEIQKEILEAMSNCKIDLKLRPEELKKEDFHRIVPFLK